MSVLPKLCSLAGRNRSSQPHVRTGTCPSNPLDVLSWASGSFLMVLHALLCTLLKAPETSRVLFLGSLSSRVFCTAYWRHPSLSQLSALSPQLKLFTNLCLPSHSPHQSLDSLSRQWGRAIVKLTSFVFYLSQESLSLVALRPLSWKLLFPVFCFSGGFIFWLCQMR